MVETRRFLLAVLALAFAGSLSCCRPRVKVKPRTTGSAWLKKPRPRQPVRRRTPTNSARRRPTAQRRSTMLQRIGDAQIDNLIDGLLREALGIEDLKQRYQRLSREQQAAVRRRVIAQPRRRSAGFDRLRRVLRSTGR